MLNRKILLPDPSHYYIHVYYFIIDYFMLKPVNSGGHFLNSGKKYI